MPPSIAAESVDSYIAAATPAARKILTEIRKRVRRCVPDATEMISYRMPAFRIDRVFFYYAAFAEHIGVFPPVRGDAELLAALAPYRGEKGNLRFRFADGIPYELIERVALSLAAGHGRTSAAKNGSAKTARGKTTGDGKPSIRKTAVQKAPVKKTAAKQTADRKAPVKKTASKKAAAGKASVTKAASTKA